MIRVFEATAYDKGTRHQSCSTYVASGVKTSKLEKINKQLKPFGITDDDVHHYFDEGELDGRDFIDTEEFFYVLELEVDK